MPYHQELVNRQLLIDGNIDGVRERSGLDALKLRRRGE
jgi:hypothetical protein